MEYSIKTIEVGSAPGAPGPEFFWMRKWNQVFTLSFQMLVIQGNGKNILVNTGLTKEIIDDMNLVWSNSLGEQCQLKISRDPIQALKDLGIKPEDIDYIIATPLKHYALGNIDKFKNAKICLSKKGWIDCMAPKYKGTLLDAREWSVPDRILKYLFFEAWDRLILLEDNHKILSGIETFWSGGHHRSSICVKIKTKKGNVIASDTFFKLENVEQNIPIGITENVFECLDCYKRVREEGDIIIPLYDEDNFLRFKDGIIV